MARLKTNYYKTIVPALMESRGFKNRNQVPRLEKIVLNVCIGTKGDRDDLKNAAAELGQITGQKAVLTKARKSISNFRLREGMDIGSMVTLRGAHMYDFLDRLINVALPRIRDFRGVSPKSFDGKGNYALGLEEQTIFPEINPDRIKRTQGMDICFVTTATNNDEGRELLRMFGMPFAS